MNTPANKSKEMLPDPGYKRSPIIQYSLDICKAFKMEPLVITRKEKTDLRQYLYNEGVKFIDIEVEGEWHQSVLKSKDHWSNEGNMLILPDTRFSSFKCIEDMQQGVRLGNNAVMALHEVNDAPKWGIINSYTLFEKSKNFPGKQMAWGLISFKADYGVDLFSNMSDNGYKLNNVGFTYLDKFEDLTRGNK